MLNGKENLMKVTSEETYTNIHLPTNCSTQLLTACLSKNMGLIMFEVQYICFIDDDDWISDNYLEELLSEPMPIVLLQPM